MEGKIPKTKKTKPVIIAWLSRYSDTMEDDKQGRWARIAYSGTFNASGFYRNKVSRWEIAWIKRIKHPTNENTFLYTVNPDFPFKGSYSHETLEQAQLEVEKEFNWFIKMVLKSDKKPTISLKIGE